MASIIPKNLAMVRERIERAAKHVGREPREITLVAVTKEVDVKKIKEAVRGGVKVFGENYVQDAREKIEKLPHSKELNLHFIGHLQKIKAKYAVELFDMIETVDSIELAKELSKRAKTKLDVLIQVNLSKEQTKGGVTENETLNLARKIAMLPNLSLRGLMTIPPFFENPEMARPYFT
ncbi:MAG: YggS family pyridoxal phosphate-dependent enzyme, partial [Deltaproteobacteria bacterium]